MARNDAISSCSFRYVLLLKLAAAIWSTKSTYGIIRNWQGDPCVPHAYLWDGLNCNYNDPGAARIISLYVLHFTIGKL
jgi:hypothetical protein